MATAQAREVELMARRARAVDEFLSVYVFPWVGVVGVGTNLVNALVFGLGWRQPTRQSVFLCFLALADLGCLANRGWVRQFGRYFFVYIGRRDLALDVMTLSDASCRLARFFLSLTGSVASTGLLLVVADRTLSIYFPLRAKQWSPRGAVAVCGAAVAVCGVWSIPFGTEVALKVTPQLNHSSCWLVEHDMGLELFNLSVSNVGVLQTLLIVALNLALIVRIRQTMARRRFLNEMDCKRNHKEVSATVVVFLLSLGYIPCAVLQVAGYFTMFSAQFNAGATRAVWSFGRGLTNVGWHFFFVQESLNFFIYSVRMPRYRRALAACCRCCCRRPDDGPPSRFSQIAFSVTR